MHAISLILRPQITAFCLGTRLAHATSMSVYVIQVASLCLAPDLRTIRSAIHNT